MSTPRKATLNDIPDVAIGCCVIVIGLIVGAVIIKLWGPQLLPLLAAPLLLRIVISMLTRGRSEDHR